MVDGGKPGVDSRDEGKHTGRNDLLFVKMYIFILCFMFRPSSMKSSIVLCYNIGQVTYLLT